MPVLPFIDSDGQPVTIEELGGLKRRIILAGRDRPQQPVNVGTSQRAIQTYYPGATKASTQIMGTREDPIVLRGWFQDTLSLIDGGPPARVAILRGLMAGQSLCRLQWGHAIERTGRVSSAQFNFFRATRIRYEITFDVDEANEVIPKIAAALNTPTMIDLKAAADEARAALGAALEVVDTVKTIGAVLL